MAISLKRSVLFFIAFLAFLNVQQSQTLYTALPSHDEALLSLPTRRLVKRYGCSARKKGPSHTREVPPLDKASSTADGAASANDDAKLGNGPSSDKTAPSTSGASNNNAASPKAPGTPHRLEKVDLLAELPAFSPQFLKNLDTTPSVLFQISLLPLLTLVHKMTDSPTTGSAQDLETVIGPKAAKANPESLKGYHEKLKERAIESLNAFYVPDSFKVSDPTLLNTLTESGTVLKRTEKEFLDYIHKAVPDFQFQPDPDTVVLVNAVSLKLRWETAFSRAIEFSDFSPGLNMAPLKTKYMTGEFYRKVYEADTYQSFSLNFLNLDQSRQDHLVAYVIHPKPAPQKDFPSMQKILSPDFWNNFYTKISEAEERTIVITMPAFRLDSKFELPAKRYTHLLQEGNGDFTKLASSVDVKIEHAAKVCADEFGLQADATTVGSFSFRSADKKYINVDSVFYFIIADQKTGTPYLISKVDKVLKDEKC